MLLQFDLNSNNCVICSLFQIWATLDEYKYTGSVLFFLLGRHLSVKLQLSGEMAAAHVNARVMLKRQWAALDHVEATIASACRQQIALPSIQEDVGLTSDYATACNIY